MGLGRQHLLDGLEPDRLAGRAGLGDAGLDRLDHRLRGRMDGVHQLVRQAHLGHALLDQLLALAVHRAIVIAEAVDALGLHLGHFGDQRLQDGERLRARGRIRREQAPVGRVAEIVDPRKLSGHGPRMIVG